ncbi:MAG: hypothetical protein ACTS27_11515, partial [Phycisphaerales bacterium]
TISVANSRGLAATGGVYGEGQWAVGKGQWGRRFTTEGAESAEDVIRPPLLFREAEWERVG